MQTTAQTTAQTTGQTTADARITTQRLGFVDVLAEGWRHYARNFVPILLIILCVNIPITVVSALVSTPRVAGMAAGDLGASMRQGLVALLAGLVAYISVLAIARAVEDSVLGRVVSARQSLWHGLKRWPAALGSLFLLWLLLLAVLVPISIVSMLAFFVLSILFSASMGSEVAIVGLLLAMVGFFVVFAAIFVPAVAIMVYLGFYPYASSLRRQGPLAALRYSWNLVRGQALRVFGYQFGIGLLTGFVSLCVLMFAFAGGVLTAIAPDLAAPIRIVIVVAQLLGSIIGSLFTVMLIVFFLNLDYLKHPLPAVIPAEGPAVVLTEAPPANRTA